MRLVPRLLSTSARRTQIASSHYFHGVVSAQTEKVVEFFLEREAAEAMIGEVREDEPALAEGCGLRRSSSVRKGWGPSYKGLRSSL
jgi:hypothetical protein